MLILFAGLILFLGIHSTRMAVPALRDHLIARRGDGFWKGGYSLVSLVGLVLIVWGYSMARPAPIIWQPPTYMAHFNILLMWPALVLLFASQVPAGRIKQAVQHPMILSVKVWAFGHLLANGDLASMLLFGSFLVWGLFNRIAVKRRGNPVFEAVSVRNDGIALIVGTAVYLWLMLQGHAWLFGVPVLPG